MEFMLFSRYPYRSLFGDDHNGLSVCRKVMRLTGTEELANKRLDKISGGQLELAYLASSLVVEPEILLLDEPTTYLDPYYIELMSKIIVEYAREKTVVIASHNIEWVSKIATMSAALKSGSINFCGKEISQKTINELYIPPELEKAL